MKRTFYTVAVAILAMNTPIIVSAQNAHEAAVKFNKNDENAVVAEYSNAPDVVKYVLKDRLEKEEIGKMRSSDGFMYYQGAVWNAISGSKLDYYFKVDGRKNKATISVLISEGYDNFISSGNDPSTIDNIKAFLNNLAYQISDYQKTLDIQAQEETVKKAEAFEEKIADKQAKLQKEQAKKQKTLEEELRKLNNLKSGAN